MADSVETLSRSELRAELAELELRLSRLFADRASFVAVEQRVSALEASRYTREHVYAEMTDLAPRIEALEAGVAGSKAVSSYKGWLATGVSAFILASASLALQFLRL